MVGCDVCEGWSHFSCIGLKEASGVMERKEFCATSVCQNACWLYNERLLG